MKNAFETKGARAIKCIGFAFLSLGITLAHHNAIAQETLTFDTFQPANSWVIVSNGYGGLNWQNFGSLDGTLRPDSEGYHTGVVSPQNVAFNLSGNSASVQSVSAFNLNSAFLTAAFVSELHVRVQGYAGTNYLYDSTYVLSNTAPTLIPFNYASVDRVVFTTVPSSIFVLDNLNVTLDATNPGCAFVVTPRERYHSLHSEIGTTEVTTLPGCTWAVSNSNSWVTILFSSETNTGSGTVTYQVEANSNGVPRSAFMQIAGQSFIVNQRAFESPGTNTIDIGRIEVAAIGHQFISSGLGHASVDYVIDQTQSTGGGGLLPPVSVDWNTNSYFALTVAAPPGKKFFIHVPPGTVATFGGFLWWESFGRGGTSPPSEASVKLTGLEGIPPDFSDTTSVLSDSHGFFGCFDVTSASFTNDLVFREMRIVGKVVPQLTSFGALNFTPHHESNLVLGCRATGPNDPGPILTLVPETVPPLAVAPGLRIRLNSFGGIAVTFAGDLQSANADGGSFSDVPGNPEGSYIIPNADLKTQQFFRVR